jgi:outer membrane protein, heavy metal efflux system
MNLGRMTLVLAAVLLLGSLCAGAAQEAPTLDELLVRAVQDSPELHSLDYQIRVAEAMVPTAGALPDPMLEVGLSNVPANTLLGLDQDTMTGIEVMVSQEVPRSSKRRLSRQAQGQEADMLRQRLLDRRNDVVRRVTRAYRDVQSMDEQIALTEQNKQLAQDMLAAAEASYAAGKTMQQDVFMAQVRLSQMLDMLITMRRERASAEVMLGQALSREGNFTIAPLPPITRTSIHLDAAQLSAAAGETSPQLAEMRVRAEQAATQERLARLGLKPDYQFSFAYMIRQPVSGVDMSGVDMWSARVGINLPWMYRRERTDQEIKAAEATRQAAEEDVKAMRNELASMLQQAANAIQHDDQQLDLLLTGLLPQSEGAMAAARAAYITGKGAMTALLDTQMSYLTMQLQRPRLVADRESNLADLIYLSGGPTPAAEGAHES